MKEKLPKSFGKFEINLITIIVSALGWKLLCSQNFEDEIWQKWRDEKLYTLDNEAQKYVCL